jgi:hypothetical protein
MADGAAQRPAGKVTEVFTVAAEREAAFRFVENEQIRAADIAAAAHGATARRCFGQSLVYVPVDGSSLNVSDHTHQKGLGLVGARAKGATGLQVMTAMAVTVCGTPVGACGQVWWTRLERSPAKKHDRRPVEQKETIHWLEAMDQVRTTLRRSAPSTKPWFQLDRGGDGWAVFADADRNRDHSFVTVRASYDRRLIGTIDGRRQYLWPTVRRQEPLASYSLAVPGGPSRKARTAIMQLQACRVTLDLVDPHHQTRPFAVSMWAVRAREVGTTPRDEAPIEWLLLTTYPVENAADAYQVLRGYAARWRIEDFHRTWKSGACRVEDTQLRDRAHIQIWGTIMTSVAMRIQRLTHLARHESELPATVELTPQEIEATILLKKPKNVKRTDIPTIGQAVRWIADLGGYIGKSSGGPPGAVVINRGLQRVEPVALVLSDGEKL